MKRVFLPAVVLGLVSLAFQARCYASTPNVCSIPLPPVSSANVPVALSLNNNHQFVKDGSLWMPHGVGIKAFSLSPADAATAGNQNLINAQNAYGRNEMLAAMQIFHADTLRFQVSQYALSQNAPGFISCLQTAVRIARNAGLVVVLAVQAEADINGVGHTALATEDTLAALMALNALYKNNQAILYELYNEPIGNNSGQQWLQWKCGDPIPSGGSLTETTSRANCISQSPGNGDTGPVQGTGTNRALGMQVLADALRQDGSTNVLMVDGLGYAQTLAGIVPDYANPAVSYLLSDASNSNPQISYAIHPYPAGEDPTASYPSKFGQSSTNQLLPATVLVSEWSAQSYPKCVGTPFLDGLKTWHPALSLVNFMNRNQYPLLAGAMDGAGILSQPVPATGAVPVYSDPPSTWVRTNYDNFLQSTNGTANYDLPGLNAGLLVSNFFANEASTAGLSSAYSCTDGVTSADVSCPASAASNPTRASCP